MSILRNITATATTNSDQLDAFSNVRSAGPTFVADGQFTYDLQPIVYEQITAGANGNIAHDPTNRCASMTLTSATDGEAAYMQSYQYYRYQSGRAQEIFVTGAAHNLTSNCEAFYRYGDEENGIEFSTDGTLSGCKWTIISGTTSGNTTVSQSAWNVDSMDGSGDENNPSGILLDSTKTQIVVISIQALYVGEVRVGFDIDGDIIWVHAFNHANIIAEPYIQSANLPISVGIRAIGAAATGSMRLVCSCVLSRGGQEKIAGYDFSVPATATAGNETRTHLLSVRPSATFNGIANRIEFALEDIELLVVGASPVYWELGLGHTLTGAVWTPANSNSYSAYEYDESGTISTQPTVIFASGFCSATNQIKGDITRTIQNKYPITLDAAGNPRDFGTLGLFVTGIGGTSLCRGQIHWKELR